jgi:hypothetical protein
LEFYNLKTTWKWEKSFWTVIQLGIPSRELWPLSRAPTWRSLMSWFDRFLNKFPVVLKAPSVLKDPGRQRRSSHIHRLLKPKYCFRNNTFC